MVYDSLTSGADKKVNANSMLIATNEANAMMHYYNVGKQDWYRDFDAIRGALSGRGEYWNIPDAPIDAMNQLKDALGYRRAINEGLDTAYGWNVGINIATSFIPGGVGAVLGKTGGRVGVKYATKEMARWYVRRQMQQVTARQGMRQLLRSSAGVGRAVGLWGRSGVARGAERMAGGLGGRVFGAGAGKVIGQVAGRGASQLVLQSLTAIQAPLVKGAAMYGVNMIAAPIASWGSERVGSLIDQATQDEQQKILDAIRSG